MTEKLLLSSKEIAALLGLTPDQMRGLDVPYIPIRGRGDGRRTHRRYSRAAVQAWLAVQAGAQAVEQTVAAGGAR